MHPPECVFSFRGIRVITPRGGVHHTEATGSRKFTKTSACGPYLSRFAVKAMVLQILLLAFASFAAGER
jgi:hypothetical protein